MLIIQQFAISGLLNLWAETRATDGGRCFLFFQVSSERRYSCVSHSLKPSYRISRELPFGRAKLIEHEHMLFSAFARSSTLMDTVTILLNHSEPVVILIFRISYPFQHGVLMPAVQAHLL